MYQRHVADDHLRSQGDASVPSDDPGLTLRLSQQAAIDSNNGDENGVPEPPPSYEQSVASPPFSSFTSNPFFSHTSPHRLPSRPPAEDNQLQDSQVFEPRLAPKHSPSAPPITLLSSTSAHDDSIETETHLARSASLPDSQSSNPLISTVRDKVPLKNRSALNFDDSVVFGEQLVVSHGNPSASSSSCSSVTSSHQGYFDSQYMPNPGQHSRTTRRLQHKQEIARYAASAPLLYPNPHPEHQQHQQPNQNKQVPVSPPPMISLSQSIVPAPPPRLLQFRSREPSSVPACPFLLCQKPIVLTKTRHERGVTVWIVCGLLFLCNTYWTTQSLISQFSNPRLEDRAVSGEAFSGVSVRREVGHLLKGFLGFQTHRYKDPVFRNYQRHQSAMNRQTIATVGILQDEQSAGRMVLGFLFVALMAIIRWWLCLTPLLVRPLFDTVHSCPHLHPYPYPEELELERRELEETEGLVAHEGMARDGTENVIQQQDSSFTSAFNGEEKKRLREREEAETRVATPAQGNATTLSTADFTTNAESKVEYQGSPSLGDEIQAPPSVSEETSAPRRYRFFQRVRATQQTRHEQGREALVADVKEIKKKRLSWRARRALRKAEDRRQRIIKASQDIGRYSLLYQLGSFLMMDRWKETVLVPGKIQPEAYED